MDPWTTIIVFCIGVLAVSYIIGSLREQSKLQRELDEERRLKLTLELRRQREEEEARENSAKLEEQLKVAATKTHYAEQQLAAKQSELTQAQEKITTLENDVVASRQAQRELDIQHLATQTRVSDLDAALSAERGRLGALQSALEARQDLVKQLTSELAATNANLVGERSGAQQREAALREQLAEHERILSSGSNQTEAIRAEMERIKKAHATTEQEAEAKVADSARKLATAENKIQLLQKEILNLVNSGGSGDAAGAMVAAENLTRAQERARIAEAKVLELEEQLSQGDTGTRKKLREAEYRVCELEFKLAEADEAKAAAVVEALSSLPAPEQPSPEYLTKLHEELAATKDKCLQLIKERDEARSATVGLHENPPVAVQS